MLNLYKNLDAETFQPFNCVQRCLITLYTIVKSRGGLAYGAREQSLRGPTGRQGVGGQENDNNIFIPLSFMQYVKQDFSNTELTLHQTQFARLS
jgi:hypothetical protein